MQVIDLSVAINENTPVYPGDPTPKIEPVAQLEKDGFNDHVLSLPTHVGTHIDAPLHMLPGGKSLDSFPAGAFVGRGRLVKLGQQFDINLLQQADIQAGDVVLFYTGMSDRFTEPVYYEDYPVLPQEAVRLLIEKQVKMVGLDTGSADNAEGFPVHKALLAAGILIIENLTNLASLEGKEFTVYALPIKVSLDGAPARVVAVIN